MKKAFLIIAIVLVVLITALIIYNANNKNKNENEITAQNYVSVGKYTDVRQDKPLKEYDGFYGNEYGASASVFFVNENTVDIDFNMYRFGGFYVENVKIDKNGIGKFHDNYGDISDGIVRFTEGKVSFEATDEEENEILKDENGNQIILEKKSTKVVTESELNKELQNCLNDYNNINSEIFEAENGNKYIALKVKPTCYILRSYEFEDEMQKYYNIDDDGHYYTIDKENRKFVTLADLYPDMQKLNEYITNEIEKKKQNWKSTTLEYKFDDEEDYEDIDNEVYEETIDEWPYDDFEGIGKLDYFENYFKIDEKNQTVRIRVLDYPYEAVRELGEVWVDVPLSL